MMDKKNSMLKKIRDANTYGVLISLLLPLFFLIGLVVCVFIQNNYYILNFLCMLFFFWLSITHNKIYLIVLKIILILVYHLILLLCFILCKKLKEDIFSSFISIEIIVITFKYGIINLFKSPPPSSKIAILFRKIYKIAQLMYIKYSRPFLKYIAFLTFSFIIYVFMMYVGYDRDVYKRQTPGPGLNNNMTTTLLS